LDLVRRSEEEGEEQEEDEKEKKESNILQEEFMSWENTLFGPLYSVSNVDPGL
jgi:hypothetical protein